MSELLAELHPLIAHLVTEAQPLLDRWGYPGLFLSSFGEGTGIPLPGQSLLIAGAVLATKGDLDIWLVLSLTFAGTLSGSCIGYLIGRTGGRELLLRCRFPLARLERVESFFARRGLILVVVARFLDGLRQTVPLVAGSLGMPWWRFFLASLAGSAAWVGVWGFGIYMITEHSHRILVALYHLSAMGWWVTGLLFVSALIWLYRRTVRR